LADRGLGSVSVVIATYERPEACERAVRSALGQDPPPLEILVCDDSSSPDTVRRLRELGGINPCVRLIPATTHTGTPAPGRNRGVSASSGEWIAFLDDDDEWLPGRLARQLERAAEGNVEVLGTNARRSDGLAYFPAESGEWCPQRGDLLRDNPLIVSSVLVRRDLLIATGGSLTQRWAKGVADYAMWLALADAGARFCVLNDVLVRYESADAERISNARGRQELAVARMFWRRWARAPRETEAFRAAMAKTATALRLGGEMAVRRRPIP
jgi:teichuronic acid biosynthesis glycosyltransferase TuaG